MADADRAQTQLVDSCAYDELCQQLQDVRKRLTEAHTRRQQLETECSSFRDRIATDRDNATRQRPLRAQQLNEQADRFESRLRQHEAELEVLRPAIAQLQQQEKDVRERMPTP